MIPLQLHGHQHRQRHLDGPRRRPTTSHRAARRSRPRSPRETDLHRRHTITQADLDAGDHQHGNRQAHGANADSQTTPPRTRGSGWKSRRRDPYDIVGDVITYSYPVTNTGNVRLHGPVTVADDKTSVTCPRVRSVGNRDSYLDPGEQPHLHRHLP